MASLLSKLHTFPVILAALFLLFATSGCDSNPVGNICSLESESVDDDSDDENEPITQAEITSGALDCVSRLCLSVPLETVLPPDSEHKPLCTGECTKDSECDRVSVSPCQLGFTCAVPMAVGPFCCKKMCICRDYLIVPEGGIADPPACDPDNPENTCCNLPGRGECSPI